MNIVYAKDDPNKPESKKTKQAKASAAEADESAKFDPNGVPIGTIPEVLDWVDNDKLRAQQALDSENGSDKPRSGLVGDLEKILNSEKETS